MKRAGYGLPVAGYAQEKKLKRIAVLTIPCVLGLYLLVQPPAFAEDCIACHGHGRGPSVDSREYAASIHGRLPCTGCHLGISPYPHGRVSKVMCGICHFTGNLGAPREQARTFKTSIHASAKAGGRGPDCQFCHGSHGILPSADPRSKTNRLKIPALCSNCHPSEFERYQGSIHGVQLLKAGNIGAATCFDCHLEHGTPAVNKPQWQLALIKECGMCHARQIETYRSTYHGKVTLLGYSTIATCVSCHGSHDILPPRDPGSTLSPIHITGTCGKCHPGATRSFAAFYAHPDETDRSRYPVLYYTYAFMTALLIGVFAFFLTHTVLWLFRSLKERRTGRRS